MDKLKRKVEGALPIPNTDNDSSSDSGSDNALL